VNTLVLPGPLFFFAALLVLGALAYALNRWPLLAGAIAAGGCLVLAWVALRRIGGMPLLGQGVDLLGRGARLSSRFELLGRTWMLTKSSLAGLGLMLTLGGLCFLLALPTPHGWAFYPFGLATLGVLTLALTAQQYVYALLLIWLAGCLMVFVLAGGRPGETTAALRSLVMISLGVMPLLLLPRYLTTDAAGYVIAPDSAAPALTIQAGQTAMLLMAAGMAILLSMVPFHGQLVAMGRHAAPMALPFALTVLPTVVLHTCFRLWEAHPALLSGEFVFDVCRWTGIAAVFLGGLGALGQRRWGALAGYVTLVDWGAGLIALGLGTRAGAEQMVQMLIWRAFSLLLVGVGWGTIFRATGRRDDLERSADAVRRHPLGVLMLVLGLLSLAGFPLSPGGLGRWPLLDRAVLGQPVSEWPATARVLVLAGAAASLGVVVTLGRCLSSTARSHAGDDRRPTGEDRAADGQETKASPAETSDGNQEKTQEPRTERRGAQGAQQARRRQELEALLSAGVSLLAIWLLGALVLAPGPWIELARRLVGNLAFSGN